MNTSKEIITNQPNDDIMKLDDPTPLMSDNIIQAAQQAEKRVDAIKKIKRLALSVTNPYDWTVQAGKPDLQTSGLEKIARLFGVNWQISEPVFEQEESGHFQYTYTGTFTLYNSSIEAVGSRGSKDGFFSKRTKYVDGKPESYDVEPSEIDRGDVKKSAYTNLLRNGIARILGIRNMSWEDLATVGINKESITAKIEYKSKSKDSTSHIASEDEKIVEIEVTAVLKKEGEKNGKAWKLFTIKNGDKAFTTFDEKIAVEAKRAMERKERVVLHYKEDGNRLKITGIFAIKPEPKKEEPAVDPKNPLGV